VPELEKNSDVDSLHLGKENVAMNETVEADAREMGDVSGETRGTWRFWLLIVAISALTLSYAVTRSFVWDEGYHLMAAQQISLGKLPYLDFCFPQTPLNAFLNAGIIRIFGQHWQAVHVAAALFTIGAMLLTAQYVLTRFPVQRWRLACALCAAVFVGLNEVVLQFATAGQAYGICLFFSVAAYRLALATPARVSVWLPLGCGLLAGIAADSSLLTAPILPVLLIWLWRYDRVGLPFRKVLAFVVGVGLAFLPVLWLYIKNPEQTLFNIVRYHALYRRVDWPSAMANHHDLLVFTSLVDSTQALTLALLAIAGLVFLMRRCDWARAEKGAFYLAAWIAAAEGAYLCTPHPTFGRYYLLLVPFLTIVGMAGLYSIACQMGYAAVPKKPALIAGGLMSLMFTNYLAQMSDQTTWQEYETLAKKVAAVTPKGGRIFADELVYFAMGVSPPSGMECSYTHALALPPREERLEHLVSEAELKQQFARHEFDTIQSCSDPEMERLGPGSYPHKQDVDECTIYWVGANK
jgi:hypothetical protein